MRHCFHLLLCEQCLFSPNFLFSRIDYGQRGLTTRCMSGEREKRRIAAADLKAKNVDIKLTRDDARREILDAIYEEDIHILNEAMDKGRRLGLEGKTDEGQQWCAHEMRRGYRQIELLQKRAEKQAEARRREIAAEEKLRETRRKKIRQYLELHGKLQDHLVRSEPLGFDANFRLWESNMLPNRCPEL